jgi:TRAP-type C4-dicarboxylate transport system permease small subunit
MVSFAVDYWISKLLKYLAYIGTASLLFMVIITVVDVASSELFNWAIPGAIEICELLMVAITYLALGYVVIERGHMRVGLLDNYFGARVLFGLQVLTSLLAFLVGGFFTWRTFTYLEYAFQAQLVTEMAVLRMVIWPGIFLTFLGFLTFTIAYILVFVKSLARSRS